MIAQDSTRLVSAAAADRSLAPREHGAYGQIGLPLAAALAMGKPSLSAVLFTLASALIFTAHEPLLLLLGRRGLRAQRYGSSRARRSMRILGAGAALAGGLGLALAPYPAQIATVVPLALGAALLRFIHQDKEKTLGGEILAASALASTSVPVALASGISASIAWGAWIAWSISFAAATCAVRVVVYRKKFQMSTAARISPVLAAALLSLALGWVGVLSQASALATAPMLLFSAVLALTPPHPSALRRIGWGLVGASGLTAAILVAGARFWVGHS